MSDHDDVRNDDARLDAAPPAPTVSRHPLLRTTAVLGVFAAVLAPFLLTPGEFASLAFAGLFVGALLSATLWALSKQRRAVTAAVIARVAGGGAAGAVVAVLGGCLVPAIGVGGAVVVLGLTVSLPYLMRRLGPKGGQPTPPAAATLLSHPGLLPPPLGVRSTEEITAAWAASDDTLAQAASVVDRAYVAELREAYLDELERRDATGLRRWLESGNALTSDPGPFLGSRGQDEPEPGTH